jgi:casein kinase I family protein HRR25
MLGPNLESTSKRCGGSFSLATMLRIAIQVIYVCTLYAE